MKETSPSEIPPASVAPGPAKQWLLILLLTLIWGSTWVVIKVGFDEGLPIFTSGALRFSIASLGMAAVAGVLARRERAEKPGLWLSFVMGTTHFGLSYTIVYWSESQLPSGLVAVIWASYPLFLALISHRFLKAERLSPGAIIGLLLGFLGVFGLFRFDLESADQSYLLPATVLLLSPLVVAIGTVLIKRGGANRSSLLMTRNGMCIGAIWMWLAALFHDGVHTFEFSARAWASMLYLGLFGSVIAFSVYFWLLRFAPASRLATITFLTSPVALMFGALVRGEAIRSETILCTALILLGIFVEKRARGSTAR